jgi:hypothetical protein
MLLIQIRQQIFKLKNQVEANHILSYKYYDIIYYAS